MRARMHWAFIFISAITMKVKTHQLPQPGVICVPVADLLGEPIRHFFPSLSAPVAYRSFPAAMTLPAPPFACPRIHQALYNQRVTLIKRVKDEVLIALPSCYYRIAGNPHPHHLYWTLATNVCPLSKLDESCDSIVPPSYNFKTKRIPVDTVALTRPWTDPVSGISFSAGTRFINTPPPSSDSETVTLTFCNYKTGQIITTTIPHSHVIKLEVHPKPDREMFITLLKQFAHPSQGIIPYVWGGCSVLHAGRQDTFKETVFSHPTSYSTYDYPSLSYPKTGLDCSGMILLAAQIVGIPFFIKNSATIALDLPQLSASDSLEVGDIIHVRGHVMVVADLEKNTLIEARGYPHGYGLVHEIALSDVFEGIQTYEELITHYKKKKPLRRKDKKGEIRDEFSHFLLLKLYVDSST